MPTSHSVTTPDLPRVATLLQRHNVECVLVGGMLARLYGSKEMTSDVDAVAHWTRSNLEALCRALDESGAAVRVRADPSGDEGNDDYRRPPGGFDVDDIRHLRSFRVRTAAGDQIDILQSIPLGVDERADYEGLLEHASSAELVDGILMRIAGIDDLVASKRAVGRPHDLRVVEELTGGVGAPAPKPRPRPGPSEGDRGPHQDPAT